MDDDATVRTVFRRMLERLGYEVETASDGVQAAELYRRAHARAESFAAVIQDTLVPKGRDGPETLTELRQEHPSLRAIATSASSDGKSTEQLCRQGFAAVLPKPVRLEEMARVLNALSA